MKKYNISFDKSVSEFDQIFKKAKITKQRIEEEIEEINIAHKKLINEITTSFEEKHIQLNRKEKQLKLELDEKVKKIKEELNKFLIESKNIILFCERSSKAIENYEKKNYVEDIETLYYISEININNEKTKEFFKIPKRNLDISFNSDLDVLDYKDYYFSGIPVPNNIKKEIQGQNVIISWDINNFKLKEFDMKNIKYVLEIKNGDKFYSNETTEKKMLLDMYKLNNFFEIKIKASIDDIFGNWSEMKKFQTQEPNFIIFSNTGCFGEQNNKNLNPFLPSNNHY